MDCKTLHVIFNGLSKLSNSIKTKIFANLEVKKKKKINKKNIYIYVLKTMKNESLLCFCATRFTAVAALQA